MKTNHHTSGQAVITAVIFLVLLSVVIIAAYSAPLARQIKSSRAAINSTQSYYAADSGTEDAIYRLKNRLDYDPSYSIVVGNSQATVEISGAGNDRTVEVAGEANNSHRNLITQLTLNQVGVELLYGVQVGDGGLTMGNNSEIQGNVYSNASIIGGTGAKITGSAIVATGLNSNPNYSWTSNDGDFFFSSLPINIDAAQSFSTSGGFNLKVHRISVLLSKVGNPPGDIILKLANNSSGKPATTNLASAEIPKELITDSPTWIDVSFETEPSLGSFTKYWIVLDSTQNSPTDYWIWRKDSTDSFELNTGKYTANCCSSTPTWYDSYSDFAFSVWASGPSQSNQTIKEVEVGDDDSGEAWADAFIDTTVHGTDCPNEYCHLASQPDADLPISDEIISSWKDDASVGGTCAEPICDEDGNYTLAINHTASLGPIIIPGDLTLGNSSTLKITGTIWVKGDMTFSNGSLTKLDDGYADNPDSSGVIVSDGVVTVNNGAIFSGLPDSNSSYVLVLSAKNDLTGNVITVGNTSEGVIYYAGTGRILFSNNAFAKEATAYGMTLEPNAIVQYEAGLGDVNFSSGPGGAFTVSSWDEVE